MDRQSQAGRRTQAGARKHAPEMRRRQACARMEAQSLHTQAGAQAFGIAGRHVQQLTGSLTGMQAGSGRQSGAGRPRHA